MIRGPNSHWLETLFRDGTENLAGVRTKDDEGLRAIPGKRHSLNREALAIAPNTSETAFFVLET